MIERWCPEDEVSYYGDQCPTCGYVDPDDEDDHDALDYSMPNMAGGHEHWDE